MTHLWLVSIACRTFQKQQKSRHSWKWTNKNPKTEVCFRWVSKAQCWMIFRFQVTCSKKKTTKLKRSQVPMEHLKICYVFTSSLNNPPPKKKKKRLHLLHLQRHAQNASRIGAGGTNCPCCFLGSFPRWFCSFGPFQGGLGIGAQLLCQVAQASAQVIHAMARHLNFCVWLLLVRFWIYTKNNLIFWQDDDEIFKVDNIEIYKRMWWDGLLFGACFGCSYCWEW